MRNKIAAAAVLTGLLFTAAPVWAHHAFAAEFDATKPLKLAGTVTRMEWINPHAWIHINVKNADGTMTEWMVECGAPNGLLRRGFTKASLPPGTDIQVNGWQAKDGSFRANGNDLTLPDGKKLFVGSSNTGAPGAGASSEKDGK